MWPALPTSDYYGPSAPPNGISRQRTFPVWSSWWLDSRAPLDGSHVHLHPFDGVGAQLCPCTIATVTPQAFTVASLPATLTDAGVRHTRRVRLRGATQP